MQRLVDAAVVVVAMIIPALRAELFHKSWHSSYPDVMMEFAVGRRMARPQPVASRGDSSRSAAAPATLPNRMSEKCPNGGMARRSTKRMSGMLAAHAA